MPLLWKNIASGYDILSSIDPRRAAWATSKVKAIHEWATQTHCSGKNDPELAPVMASLKENGIEVSCSHGQFRTAGSEL